MINQDKNVKSDPLKASPESPRLFDVPDNPETGGPQFGSKSPTGNKDKFRGWINKYGSSVVLPIIALAILAGGIYLYTNQQNEEMSLLSDNNLTDIQEQIPGSDSGPEISQTPERENISIQEIVPEGRKQSNQIIEKAASGDGITHLARRALNDYLEGKSANLSNEQKIYVEDYLKDRTGSEPLEVGEEVTFSEDLIKEAIDASLELTPEQLENLEQYSALVAW